MLAKIRKFFGDTMPRDLKYKIKFKWMPIVSVLYPETLIISYPKCGRSWLRLLVNDTLANEFSGKIREGALQEERLSRLHKRIPSIGITHDDDPMLKTTEEIICSKKFYKNKNVVLLVRDPRDVIISWYFQVINRGSLKNFKEEIDIDSPKNFIYNKRGGLETIIKFYNVWWENRELPKSFYVMSYESLRSDTKGELQKLFKFWGVDDLIGSTSLDYSIEKNSFENLKSKEKRGEVKHGAFKTEEKNNQDAYKVRKGKVGGYIDYLEKEDIEYMDKMINKELNKSFRY